MNVPKLRFKEFNDEWKKEKFLKFTYYAGKRNKDGLDLTPYAITNNLGFIPQTEAHNEFGYMKNTDRKAYNIVTKNSFAYNPARINVGSIGYYEGSENIIVSSLYEVFKTKEYIDDKFIWYWLKSDKFPRWIDRLQEGSVRQYFYYDKLCETVTYIPSLKEQEKIGAFLSLLDKKIELQSKKIEALKLYKKGLNNIIFQFEGEEKLIKDVIIEYNKRTSQNNQFEVLSSTMNGIAIQNNYFNKKQASEDTTGYKIVPNGYITYRSMSDTGEFHFNIQNITEVGIVSPAYPVFITTGEVDKIYFLNYLNENTNFKNSILENKEGGTRYALSFSKFKCLKIYLPNLATQKYFGGMISTINKKIIFEAKKLSKLESLKKGLMQSMFV